MEDHIQELESRLRSYISNTERRLEKLESVHTRYTGDRGPQGLKGEKGEKGEKGDAGQSYDLTQFRTESNALRDELHNMMLARLNDLDANFRRYEEALHSIFTKEVEAFCTKRDEAVKCVNDELAASRKTQSRPNGRAK